MRVWSILMGVHSDRWRFAVSCGEKPDVKKLEWTWSWSGVEMMAERGLSMAHTTIMR
jgi:hypothetical protein